MSVCFPCHGFTTTHSPLEREGLYAAKRVSELVLSLQSFGIAGSNLLGWGIVVRLDYSRAIRWL